jgi:exopolysaccharide biosynthesis predicted pyruvyltransferase EpsI
MPKVSPLEDFELRLKGHQVAVSEFVQQVGPIWLLTCMPGNIGDHLIWAGTENLLESGGVDYTSISKDELQKTANRVRHGTLVIPGSGALTSRWCEWLPELVVLAAGVFDRVVILPSEYEPEISVVGAALAQPNVFAFAREVESFSKIKKFGRAALAPDPALWARGFLQAPVNQKGDEDLGNVLLVLRTDAGSLLPSHALHPAAVNDDISLTTKSMEEFMDCIGTVDTVVSDRLHVVVAATMLGKNVRFVDPCNNKISRYTRYNFQGEFTGHVQQRDEQWLVDLGFARKVK